jgi:hypothetical protein
MLVFSLVKLGGKDPTPPRPTTTFALLYLKPLSYNYLFCPLCHFIVSSLGIKTAAFNPNN